jgi:hypothetical protein
MLNQSYFVGRIAFRELLTLNRTQAFFIPSGFLPSNSPHTKKAILHTAGSLVSSFILLF